MENYLIPKIHDSTGQFDCKRGSTPIKNLESQHIDVCVYICFIMQHRPPVLLLLMSNLMINEAEDIWMSKFDGIYILILPVKMVAFEKKEMWSK
jgi:hypothetical protein